LSYFYSSSDTKRWWTFEKPLVYQVPWCLDWTKGLQKGIFLLDDEIPQSQILYALNASVVALIGDVAVDKPTERAPESEFDEEVVYMVFHHI
jgi:polynucleotide 5'-hydroxyl-kinase GRC3/NOL9